MSSYEGRRRLNTWAGLKCAELMSLQWIKDKVRFTSWVTNREEEPANITVTLKWPKLYKKWENQQTDREVDYFSAMGYDNGNGDMSNYCLSAFSWSTVQLQWECYKYCRGGYYLHISHKDRGSIWLPEPPGDCFREEYFFSLCLAFSSALSLVSINSTAASSPPLAALPSQCPTPSSFPSVCTDPWGPRLPPGARHGPTSINISAGLHWWAERVSQNGSEPSDISEKVLGMEWATLMGNGFLKDCRLFCMF